MKVALIIATLFALYMGLIYGYKNISKKDIKNVGKIHLGAGLALGTLAVLFFIETQ